MVLRQGWCLRGQRSESGALQASQKAASKSLRWGERGALGVTLAWALLACNPVVEEPAGRTQDVPGDRVRSAELATVTSPMELFQEALDAGAVVAGTTAVYLGDRVEVKTATDGFAAVSNTGAGTTPNFITYLGTDTKAGQIWSRTKVELRDRARVYGAVRTNRPVIQGNQVVIDEGIVAAPLGATKDILDPLPSLPVRSTTPLTIWSGQDVNLQPGSHGAVTVQGGATLRLDADTYSFAQLTVEWGGKIVAKSECGPAIAEARSGFTFRGEVLEAGGNDPGIGLIVRYEGTTTANVESAFRGIVIAPKAEVNLGTAVHEGRFFAKVLRVQAGGKINDFVPFSPTSGQCGSLPAPGPEPVPTDIGPAPSLTSPADLDAFLDWFYVITKGEKTDAEARIAAVSPTSGVREAVIQRFEAARSAGEFGKGLMLIAMLGAMRDPDVRVFLMDLLGQPVPGAPDPAGIRATTYDDEVGYRRQALHILNAYGAPATTAAVMDVAKNHPIAELRNAAIQTLRYQKSPAEIEALRAELRPEDEFYLDLPRRSSPSFDADTVQFRAKYSN